jgi:hypothetical protein
MKAACCDFSGSLSDLAVTHLRPRIVIVFHILAIEDRGSAAPLLSTLETDINSVDAHANTGLCSPINDDSV